MTDDNPTTWLADAQTAALVKAADRALQAERDFAHMTGPQIVEAAISAIADTQAELGRLSGLTQNTLRAMKAGKKPSTAQRAAMAWAVFKRWA